MSVCLEAGVTATVSASGCLELFSELSWVRFRSGPTGAAMWIALRRHNDDPDLAADMLAELWDVDRDAMRNCLRAWVAELCEAGLVRSRPGPSGRPGSGPTGQGCLSIVE